MPGIPEAPLVSEIEGDSTTVSKKVPIVITLLSLSVAKAVPLSRPLEPIPLAHRPSPGFPNNAPTRRSLSIVTTQSPGPVQASDHPRKFPVPGLAVRLILAPCGYVSVHTPPALQV